MATNPNDAADEHDGAGLLGLLASDHVDEEVAAGPADRDALGFEVISVVDDDEEEDDDAVETLVQK